MTEYLKDALGKLLDVYDERRRAQQARDQKIRDDDAAFLQKFSELRKTVIRPVLEEAGRILESRGHGYSIGETEFAGGGGADLVEAGIAFTVVPLGMGAPLHKDDHGHTFSITTRHYSKTLWIDAGKAMNIGGAQGSKGAFALENINRQLVEEALLKFVAGVIEA